ncbi:hypothetical protein LZ32DRAFT_79142 [Colletotrichum eremochloae]|nr:hypothetical protein LZ32DRAFT_79142 [Colletotrichum eremochloae]
MSHLRKLLPAGPEDRDAQLQGLQGRDSNQEQPQRQKRKAPVRIACINCRAKKISCDGKEPMCGSCSRRSLICVYGEDTSRKALRLQISRLQQEVDDNKTLIQRLKTLSEDEAIETLRALRASTPAAVLPTSDGGLTRSRPSDLSVNRALLPPTQSSVESELQMLHPFAYPVLEPLNLDSTDVHGWFTGKPDITSTANLLLPSPLRQEAVTGRSSSTPNAFPGREQFAAQLKNLTMSYWSRTPIDNELTSDILSHFFTAHYPIFACFDAHQFLDDLVERRLDYCSPFLVTSVLTLACQSFTTFDVRSASFSVAFQQEAKVLWNAERSHDSALNLAAMCYLAMASGMSGHEDLASALLKDIRAMATRMNLFGAQPTDELLQVFYQLPLEKFKAMAAAAWGTYGWLTFHATHYPARPIAFPPLLPIPGDADRRSGGLMWPPHPLPSWAGQTTMTLAKFWRIVNELDHVCSIGNLVPLSRTVSMAFVESRYRMLLSWADECSTSMQRDENSPSHVYFFHAMYHITITRLFQPLLDRPEQLRLRSFKSGDSRPATIFAASMRQLKRLFFWYYTRLDRHSDNGWFTAAVLQITSVVLRNTSDPDWRIYFQLCFNYWKEAYVRYRVYLQVVQANLTLALRLGAIGRRTAVAMMGEMRAVGKHHQVPEEATLTAIADYQLAMENLKNSKMDVLSRDFAGLAVTETASGGGCSGGQPPPPSHGNGAVASSSGWLKTVLADNNS